MQSTKHKAQSTKHKAQSTLEIELERINADWLKRVSIDPGYIMRRAGQMYTGLGPGENLLDVGCGYGYSVLFFSYLYQKSHGIENSKERYELSVKNTQNCENSHIFNCDATEFVGDGTKYDRVLFETTLSVFDKKETFFKILTHLKQFFSPDCKILLVAINDMAMRDDYLKQLPDELEKKGFSKSKIDEIVEKNSKLIGTACWEKSDFSQFFSEFNCKVSFLESIYKENVCHEVTFDTLIEFQGL